jgi:penicillin-binding protein 2
VHHQQELSRQRILARLRWFYAPVAIVFLVLAARLWQLQIIRGREYALQAERNRIRTLDVTAPRGAIMDRNREVLVDNRPSFNILLYREYMKDESATRAFAADNLKVAPADFDALLQRGRREPVFRPLIVKEDVGIDDISIVEAHRHDRPEIQLGPQPRRLYRRGKLAAHVLGYVGEVSDEELSSSVFPDARPGDLVGKSGVERTYNACLTGTDGKRRVLVDSQGRELGILGEIEAVIGGELSLTLDARLQEAAESLLAGKVGSIVAMDPRNGEILAMASAPAFDPNRFASRLSEEEWNGLINDPDRPLQNRAIQNSYSPGSTFKVVMALTALEEGVIDESSRVFCGGAAAYYNRLFHCWSKGHGYLNVVGAIQNSCNIFFYEMGKRVGIEKIAEHAGALGLGERTGIDLPGERAGVMPSPEWKQRTRGDKWYAGETISVAIGQGAVSVTPLQLLRAVSAIAMGGRLVTPHLLLRAGKPAGAAPSWPVRELNFRPETTADILAGMWGSVNAGGTGGRARVPGLDICGKTGTAQVIGAETAKKLGSDSELFEDHSWFVGFANRDNPEIAVVVFVEHGGKGGVAAAPLAGEIFRKYFEIKGFPAKITQVVQTAAARQ